MIKTIMGMVFTLIIALIMVGNIEFLIVKINNFTANEISVDLCITNKCNSLKLKSKDYALKIFFPEKAGASESVSVSMNVLFNGDHIEYKDIGYFVPESIFLNNTEEICLYQENNKLLLNLCP
jgi:hypothetical protein